ncbi:MAG: hypothetical protein KatS3mg048_3626 [Caldilinea sp.]|nr:MAG: hypothetical protein KatS3mg048_3626 [Caldilinea sp.]
MEPYSTKQITETFHTTLQAKVLVSTFGLTLIRVNLLVTLKSLCIQLSNCFLTILCLEEVSISHEIAIIIFTLPGKKMAQSILPIPSFVQALIVFMRLVLKAKSCLSRMHLEAMTLWVA